MFQKKDRRCESPVFRIYIGLLFRGTMFGLTFTFYQFVRILAKIFLIAFCEVAWCGETYGVCYLSNGFISLCKHLLSTFQSSISDELYCELNYISDTPSSLAKFPELRDRVIMINGFSKSYAMTGWRLGYVIGPKDLVAPMTKIHQYCIMSSPSTAQLAVIEAAYNGDDEVKAMRDEYNHRRRVIIDGLKNAGLDCFTPSGAFYAFPCIKGLGLTSEEFCEKFLMSKKVAIVPGNAFGECGEGYVRISYAASMKDIKTAMERLAEFVSELKEGKIE